MNDKKAVRVQDYMRHIVAAVDRIETYVQGLDLTAFMASSLVQDAVIRNFEIIGEAASKIQAADSAFAQSHPQLRLDLAYRMRNALIHGYDSVNLVTVWNTITNDLPILKRHIAALSSGESTATTEGYRGLASPSRTSRARGLFEKSMKRNSERRESGSANAREPDVRTDARRRG